MLLIFKPLIKNLACAKICLVAFGFFAFLLAGCTSVNVRPVPPEHSIKSVTIIENPKVKINDFTDALIAGFARHGINAKVVPETAELKKDEYIVTYVAYRNWDFAPYLRDATVKIEKNNEVVALAEYHLRGGGGLSLAKWNSTKSKMDPVIDKLLKNF